MAMWKDPQKGLRKHSLLTQAEQKKLPPLYSTDGKGNKAVAQVKLFSPWNNWEWYLTEFDQTHPCLLYTSPSPRDS